MSGRPGRAPGLPWWPIFLSLVVVGCSGSPDPVSMVPDPLRARQAIEAAMASWKAGRPTGVIEPTSPRIQVVDTHRKPGQRLDGFEILAESADGRMRAFTVRLSMLDPEERPVARFLAVGLDPVLIFRQEDFDLLMHWEHRMDPAPGESPPEPAPVPPSK